MADARTTRVLAALLAAAVLLGGCAEAPPRVAAPIPAAAPVAGAEIARDDDFLVVRVAPGETAATLAQRHLGDRGKAFWILEANGGGEPAAGDIVAIPLRPPNPIGVSTGGFQAIPILCYHRFGAKAAPLTVTPAAFAAQMDYLARNGYTVVPALAPGRVSFRARAAASEDGRHHHRRRLPLDLRRRLPDPRPPRLSGHAVPLQRLRRRQGRAQLGADEGDAGRGRVRHPAALPHPRQPHAEAARRVRRPVPRPTAARGRCADQRHPRSVGRSQHDLCVSLRRRQRRASSPN